MALSSPEIARIPVQNYLKQVTTNAQKLDPESFQQLVRGEEKILRTRQKAVDTLTQSPAFLLRGTDEIITLGPQARRLLMLLASRSGEVLDRQNIADTVGFGNIKGANVRISDLRKKLGHRDYIHSTWGQGYCASGDFPLEGLIKQPSNDLLPTTQPNLIITGVKRLDGADVNLTPAERRLVTQLARYTIVDRESLALAVNPSINPAKIPFARTVNSHLARINRKLSGSATGCIVALDGYGYYLRRPLPFTFRTTDIPPDELQKIIRPSSQNHEPKQEPIILMGVDVSTLAPKQADMFGLLVKQSALGRYAARRELSGLTNPKTGNKSRVVDVIISQLRGKIKKQNPNLRIAAVKGEGYALEVIQTD